eukprot:SAG22_NODE_40_length_25739_cov_38.630031_7_plen_165_part_00
MDSWSHAITASVWESLNLGLRDRFSQAADLTDLLCGHFSRNWYSPRVLCKLTIPLVEPSHVESFGFRLRAALPTPWECRPAADCKVWWVLLLGGGRGGEARGPKPACRALHNREARRPRRGGWADKRAHWPVPFDSLIECFIHQIHGRRGRVAAPRQRRARVVA